MVRDLSEYSDRLERWLTWNAKARSVRIGHLAPLRDGSLARSWRVRVQITGGEFAGDQTLVIRNSTQPPILDEISRVQEFAVLEAAFHAGVSVPEPLWLCQDAGVLGEDFLVTRAIADAHSGQQLARNEAETLDRQELLVRIGRELARLHTIKPDNPRLDTLPGPGGAPMRRLIDRFRAALDDLGTPQPGLEWGLAWLERHLPPGPEPVLCHQAFHVGRLLLDSGGLAGIIGWHHAGWGDPLADLGSFCARCWRFGQYNRPAGGLGARDILLDAYNAASGRTVDADSLRVWEVVAHLRAALTGLEQGRRHVSGQRPSLVLALAGRLPATVEYDMLRIIETDGDDHGPA